MKANVRARARGWSRGEEPGSLMILAGIVITLAFILTSLTLAQVSTLEREAAAERPNPLVTEWRFLHERLATNLEIAIAEDTTNESFRDSTLPRIVATFRNVQEEKGYDTVIRLAGSSFVTSEADLKRTESGAERYYAYTPDGVEVSRDPWDQIDDGMLWKKPCPIDATRGCIVGVYLYVRLADVSGSIEETILFAVNQP